MEKHSDLRPVDVSECYFVASLDEVTHQSLQRGRESPTEIYSAQRVSLSMLTFLFEDRCTSIYALFPFHSVINFILIHTKENIHEKNRFRSY